VQDRSSKCANCGQGHSAAYKGCSSYLVAKQITACKTLDKISYAAAAAKIRDKSANELALSQSSNASDPLCPPVLLAQNRDIHFPILASNGNASFHLHNDSNLNDASTQTKCDAFTQTDYSNSNASDTNVCHQSTEDQAISAFSLLASADHLNSLSRESLIELLTSFVKRLQSYVFINDPGCCSINSI
jgi:hypothetical protein